jgi:hypothetical protein
MPSGLPRAVAGRNRSGSPTHRLARTCKRKVTAVDVSDVFAARTGTYNPDFERMVCIHEAGHDPGNLVWRRIGKHILNKGKGGSSRIPLEFCVEMCARDCHPAHDRHRIRQPPDDRPGGGLRVLQQFSRDSRQAGDDGGVAPPP